jgi:(p)ppGpp synthase/HD superfamily hydrolase
VYEEEEDNFFDPPMEVENPILETTAEVVAKAEAIAKRAMKGFRKGSKRPAWEHPADVVALVKRVPGVRPNLGTQNYLEALAWLHDVLEDTEVTEEGLRNEGIPEHVILGVKALTREEWMTTNFYYRNLDRSFELVKIVKVCDRIANLTEGKPLLPRSWWMKYTGETKHFVAPLTFEMGEPWRAWLLEQLKLAASGPDSQY